MAKQQHVFLIPGFFGFVNFGDLGYFTHVKEFLQEKLEERGVDGTVTVSRTNPAASIKRRAERLYETIERGPAADEGDIHLIGHSTGGLDARLLVTENAQLGDGVDAEKIGCRVKSVVSIATPHYGTPLAPLFASVFGRQLLKLFSLSTIYTLRFGRLPLSAVLKMGAAFVRLDDHVGLRETIADQLFEQLLADFKKDRREKIRQFFEELEVDQALINQLHPEGIDAFNAACADRSTTRYGCVVSGVSSPGLHSMFQLGLDPYAQASHGIFTVLYGVIAASRWRLKSPELSAESRDQFEETWGEVPGKRMNDGVVPTRSQLWGELIAAVEADHLDTIGHFDSRNLSLLTTIGSLQDLDSTGVGLKCFGRESWTSSWKFEVTKSDHLADLY